MNRLFAWLRKRKQDRFFATFPPVVRKHPDFPQWVIDQFREQRQREFNPYSYDDRLDVRRALDRAIIRALPVLFGREAGK